MSRFLQADVHTLIERDSRLILRGAPRQIADELQRRREQFAFSQVSVNAAYMDQFPSS